MDTVISQKTIEEVFDQITREVTKEVAGIRLYTGKGPPNRELCTVHTVFKRGFDYSLSLCAEISLFTRLTRHMLQEDEVTFQDVEEFTKEYFNVLCGHIAAKLFQITKVAARFEVPVFQRGRYHSGDGREQFVLNYFSDQNEVAELIYCYNNKNY